MYERRSQPLAHRTLFYRRVAASFAGGLLIVVVSMLAGMSGYHYFEGLGWMDAFVNAAMILSGMGPLDSPQTTYGKPFAGSYALYSGFAVILIAGISFAPIIHRLFHRFHLESGRSKE